MMSRVNHALEADCHHSLERIGADPRGIHASAAREHAREAGREAYITGSSLGDISGHISEYPVLVSEYGLGFEESESIEFFLREFSRED
ncbi:hypothetical protein C3743_39840 [Burkholderia contaminans]|uniref:Uncharacterized protein n=1 Tax=Burkholderia contaminans TaxID=488447 RepID=A0A2S5DM19_9BURK|nr:hypothetical protein WK28_23675 [Burkholderia vietnamiensis]POZ80138.1 hypothetical protein C3743_39840 [Burkholderia contaminans]